ncbi:MAG TPA: YifB family Mg chelatase-like AAA ATPase [Candidatus Choladousia intestinigallinarum]|nr:YifB family Mg chelatase-like AAA ATPase [Candidatus Choladousia intestinigallinarum]
MYSEVISAAVCGVESRLILVEADVANGLPGFSMVGFLSSEVREAQDRVRTAIYNSGVRLEAKKVTVNLAPGDIRKSGSGFDLPIAVAVLAAYGVIPRDSIKETFFAGELGLDGRVNKIRGILGMVMEARKAGCRSCVLPKGNAPEGAVIEGIQILGAGSLREVMDHFNGAAQIKETVSNIEEKFQQGEERAKLDFADIRGQRLVKRAIEIAAAGMHNILISGPPGCGKSMMAKRIPTILPPLSKEEALEVSRIYSVAGLLPEAGLVTRRPFRMPHHTISGAAMAGGGFVPGPGEISFAHRGVLYLDELPEYQSEVLEVLRQPMEDGRVILSRGGGTYIFPCEFMLAASRNPCKCGYYPDRSRCRCTQGEVERYLHRISRPLLDRIDLHVEAEPVKYQELTGEKQEETSEEIRERVQKARQRQQERYRGTALRFNRDLTPALLEEYCPLGEEERRLTEEVYRKKDLTARSFHRLLKVSRTIADLEGSRDIQSRHISEALLYRPVRQLM